ncbi:hypothetical protein ACFV7Q_33965 [Streptomyces sp. NPDC059851]|uniref:hypothetical protein n=1 Tax=Streptomyces sp. NPDC059851 TaxID=3346971 RepID=UPI00366162ED
MTNLIASDGQAFTDITETTTGTVKRFVLWGFREDEVSAFDSIHYSMWVSQLRAAMLKGLQATISHPVGRRSVQSVELTAGP